MESDEKIIEVILSESKKLQKVLNDHFLNEFAKLHNIPIELSQLHAKQEIVAKRGYFLNVKKKYGLFIVNSEGVPVKELETKGVISKRSDYPRFTRDSVNRLLELLLKEEEVSFKKIRAFIEEARDKIINYCIEGNKEVGRPVSFSKQLSNYKVVPSHIHAMLLWNDLEYEYFVPGTRGYLFKIKGIDPYLAPEKMQEKLSKYSKANSVVLPYEEEKLPEYYKIDLENMIDFCWDSRVSELLEPIMDKIDTKRKIEKLSMTTW
jgi:DNA polymerase elongation subunit (family B)